MSRAQALEFLNKREKSYSTMLLAERCDCLYIDTNCILLVAFSILWESNALRYQTLPFVVLQSANARSQTVIASATT